MARHWTPEERAKQAALIASWQPWKHSTGARTPEGKAKASRNAYKGGQEGRRERFRAAMKELGAAWDKVIKANGGKKTGISVLIKF
jgi:hypothetical protein